MGGVESVLGHYTRLLTAAGHQVRIIAGRGHQVDDAVEFVSVPLIDSLHPDILAAKQKLDCGQIPPHFSDLVAQLYAELHQATAVTDVLIAHNVASLHKNLALTAALRQLCAQPNAPRLILWHHDLAWTTPRYQPELHPGWPWDLLRQDWTEVQPKHVVVSELRRRELADLLHLHPETIAVIPSGIDVTTFLKLETETTVLYHRLQLNRANPFFLLPVRITRRKNIELAIEVVAALRDTFPQVQLLVTGPPGPHNPTNQVYFEALKNRRDSLGLATAVHFLAESVAHYLPDPVIADFYRLADALLFPSREEGFGIPMLEAGLTGLPIFCTDIPPFHEIAGPYATYFSPSAETAVVAQQIATTLQNHTGYQLRQQIRHTYTWENIYQNQIKPLL